MRILFVLALVAFLSASCEKIIAEDISQEMPVLILPMPADTIALNPTHFKWEEMFGATRYHLMVVSPSFSNIESYVLDTMVTGTDFFFDLDSNVYELKLSATNGAYTSQTFGPVQFWVGVSAGSSGNNVVLNLPAAGVYKNASFSGEFSWNALNASGTYEFSLRKGANFATGQIVDNQNNLGTLNYTTAAVLDEDQYIWGVKQYFTSGYETPFSTRVLYIDLTLPNVGLLASPANLSSEIAGNIVFTWSNGSDPGTVHAPVSSYIEISTDQAFATIFHSASIQGNTVTVNVPAGVYYWRVTNSDEAGNIASASLVNKFTITP